MYREISTTQNNSNITFLFVENKKHSTFLFLLYLHCSINKLVFVSSVKFNLAQMDYLKRSRTRYYNNKLQTIMCIKAEKRYF